MGTTLTNPQRVILAAAAMPGAFGFADLVARAYEDNRDTFGLPGYADRYPDSNKVLTYVMGRKGLANPKRGVMTKVGPKRYRLTSSGIAEARRIQDAAAEPAPGPVPHSPRIRTPRLPVAADRKLSAAASSPAFHRWRAGQGESVAFPDAAAFLEAAAAEDLKRAARFLVEGELLLRSGQVITAAELRDLGRAATYFGRWFARRLTAKERAL